jgi:hypothetical protein
MNRNFPHLQHSPKKTKCLAAAALAIALLLPASLLLGPSASAQNTSGNNAFGFNSANISGFPTGAARLTGGGAFNLATGFVKSAGGFGCFEDVNQGPLTGCLSGQGVRWDTASLLASTTFKCTGAASEPLKTANTSPGNTTPDTVVLLADFYRAGDGNDESFTGKMIVSSRDLDPETPGVQNVWIEKIGCGTAVVNFNR